MGSREQPQLLRADLPRELRRLHYGVLSYSLDTPIRGFKAPLKELGVENGILR